MLLELLLLLDSEFLLRKKWDTVTLLKVLKSGQIDVPYFVKVSDIISLILDGENTKTATIVLRGGTQNTLDDLERAIDDGVNVIKAVTRDSRLVAGAGAFEIELSRQLQVIGETTPGLNQYAINKFAESLEVVPRTLADNAGLDVLFKMLILEH